MGRVCQIGVAQFGEVRELFQVEGGLCDESLEAAQDGVGQRAERCVGDVPVGTNINLDHLLALCSSSKHSILLYL